MTFTRILLAVTLFAALAGCVGAGKTTGEFVDDAAITAKVKARLFEDPATSGWQITVITADGVVQLAGFVKSEKEREHAAGVARKVAGVRAVKNDLIVK